MSRKQKVRKTPGQRNPFVAAALFKKAGSHRTPDKALRRQANMDMVSVAQREQRILLPDRIQFGSAQTNHPKNIAESHLFSTVFFNIELLQTPPLVSHSLCCSFERQNRTKVKPSCGFVIYGQCCSYRARGTKTFPPLIFLTYAQMAKLVDAQP